MGKQARSRVDYVNRRCFVAASAAVTALPHNLVYGRTIASARDVDEATVAQTENQVLISQIGSDATALAKAIAVAREVVIDVDVTVATDVELRAGLVMRFAGGRLLVPPTARIVRGVLFAEGIGNVTLINPLIDASATAGVVALKLIDVSGVIVERGVLTRSCVHLESNDNEVVRNIVISGLTVAMGGYRSPAIYLSGVRGVVIRNGECSGGLEGIGIYNGGREISITSLVSHSHVQDGFVIVDGKQIDYVDCIGRNNGQSGFCTQDLVPRMGAQFITWTRCQADDNAADGYDIHGSHGAEDSFFRMTSCVARRNGPANGGCGFYILRAPGTFLDGCSAYNNRYQGLFANESNRLIANRFQSVSNADAIADGPNKAGILIYNSDAAQIVAPTSGNRGRRAQDYGLAFTGTSKHARLSGGDLSGNRTGALFAQRNVVSMLPG